MSEEIRGYTKEEFLSLILNQLKTEEDKETFYQKMLLGLHENAPVLQSEEDGPEGSTIPSDVLKNIFNNIDWEMLTGTEYGEDEFFNGQEGLYTSLGEELKRIFEAEGNDYKRKDLTGEGQSAWWTNSYWNESVAKLLQIFAQRIDPNNIMTYEKSGLLIELIPDQENPDVEGMIDTEHLRAGLLASGATAALRMIDIMDADAGNSFEGDKDTYWYGDYYDSLTLTYTDVNKKEHPTILTKVLFKENADTILAKIRNEEEITVADFKKLIKLDATTDKTDDSACIYSGIINADLEDIGTSNILINLTEGGDKYRFKVVKNPWVIPWYNFDGETYSRVRGDDKRVSALTDKNKLDFTRLDESESEDHRWIRLLMPRYKRKVEVEDLNRNFWVIGQVLAGICADLFDDEGPIGGMIKGLLKEIAQLWENVVYLWAALALLSQKKFYGVTHSEVIMLPAETFLPYLTYDNFANGEFNPLAVTPKLEYLTRMYPEQNLMILPCIRLNNYEKNYYGEICIPGVYAYDRNDETWSVFSFECSTSQNFIQSGKLDFILLDYQDNIYGISEEEEKYKYLAPLSSATNVHSSEDTRFYGIARDKIDFSGQLYKYNPIVEGQEDRPTWESDIQVNLHLELHDLAAELVTKEERKIVSFDGTYNNDTIELSNVINVYGFEPLEKIEPDYIRIEKGYYQGELLSTCLDALRRILNIIVLPAAQLTPVFEDQATLVNNYPTPMYEALRQQDSQLLEALLKLVFEYNLDGAESFWDNHDAEDIFTTPENYFGTWNAGATALEGKKTREQAPYSRYDFTNYPSDYKKYYDETKGSFEDDLTKWKDNMRKRFTDKTEGTTINKDSILFITGRRDYSYPNASGETQPGVTCDEYLPYNSSDEYKGFLAPIFAPIRGRGTVETGSALMFKIDDENYAYGFYKEHNTITGFSDGDETQQYKKLHGISNPFIWSEFIERSGETLPTWGYRTDPSDPWDWTIPVRDLINNDTDANYIDTISGGGATGAEQYLVMRQDGQPTFTEDNWRVVRLHSFAVEPHLLHENGGTYTTRNDLQRYYYSVSNDVYVLIYEGLLRKYADELYIGGMTGIKSMGDALKAYFSDVDGIAGIKQDTYYQSAPAEEKQKIDDMVAYFDNKYNTFKIGIEEHYYFYYQATLHGKYPTLYQEQCWIYNHLNGSDWSTEISDIYSEFDKEAYHTSSFGLKDPEGNTFSDRYFIDGNITTDLGIYVFGPQENGDYLYARRAVRRAYDMDSNHPVFVDEVNEVGNVDDLKRGFTVVSATSNTIELEKYKTKHNGKYQSDYYNNTPGEFPDDNFPYNTEWDPDYIDYE